jgi:rhodanese-related sulfurtransferase
VAQLPYNVRELSLFRDDTFLVYCDTEKCAEEGMAILVTSGFGDAVLMDGGVDRWLQMGFRTCHLMGDQDDCSYPTPSH